MPRFHYTVVSEFMEEDVDASFLSDEKFDDGKLSAASASRRRFASRATVSATRSPNRAASSPGA